MSSYLDYKNRANDKLCKSIEKLKNKEIDCHKFLYKYRYVTMKDNEDDAGWVINELSKYPDNDECIICLMYIYRCSCLDHKFMNYEIIIDRFKTINRPDNPRSDVVSLFYRPYVKTNEYSADGLYYYYIDEDLEKAAIEGDRVAMFKIAENIYQRSWSPEIENEKIVKMMRYYQWAADKGDKISLKRLMSIKYNRHINKNIIEKISELIVNEDDKYLLNRLIKIGYNPEFKRAIEKIKQLVAGKDDKTLLKYLRNITDETKLNKDTMREVNRLYLKCGKYHQIKDLYLHEGCDSDHELLHSLILYLNTKLKEKEDLITELLYEPGGRKYREAKTDFHKRTIVNKLGRNLLFLNTSSL